MSVLALLNPSLTAVTTLRPTVADVAAVYPLIAFGDLVAVSPATLADYPRLVLVQETAPPPLEYGDTLTEGAENIAGTWTQTWSINAPTLQEMKDLAKSRANDAARDKISTLELARGLAQSPAAPRPRTQQVLDKLDDVRARIDAATTRAEVKAILDELEVF